MKASEYQRVSSSIDIRKKIVNTVRAVGSPHYHNAYELHYFLKGEADFFIRDEIYNVKQGDLLFINTFEIHNATYSTDHYEKIVMLYKPSLTQSLPSFQAPDVFMALDEKFNSSRLVSLPQTMQKRIEPILEGMLERYEENNPYSLVYLHSYLSLLLTYTTEYLDSAESINDQSPALNQKIRSIIAYLDINLNQDLTLDGISTWFNTDKFHLCRYFKKHTGLSIIEYANRMRVIQSEKLMMQSKHSITEICFMVGFNNLTHFERTFKQYTGMSPRNYKKGLLSSNMGSE